MTIKISAPKFILSGMIVLGLASLTGCGRIGPKNLSTDHMEYNKAVNTSLNQQLVLNIVRAHYNEPSLFVSIDNVTSRDTYQAVGGLSFFSPFNSVSGASKANPTLTSSLTGTIKQEPSYIYAPETNDKYAVELLQPLRIKALYLVIESEAEIGDILRLMLRRIGPYINFPAQPLEKPYKINLSSVNNFIELTRIFTKIYAENGYQINIITKKNGNGHYESEKLIIPLPRHPHLSHKQWHLLNTLGIQPSDPAIILCDRGSNPAKDTIHIQVRSLMNVTDFLAFGVNKPLQRINGIPKNTLLLYREYQQLLTKHLINIRISNHYPSKAYIAISLHNRWYYIDNDDRSSKTTFRLYRVFNDLTQADTKASNILISS